METGRSRRRAIYITESVRKTTGEPHGSFPFSTLFYLDLCAFSYLGHIFDYNTHCNIVSLLNIHSVAVTLAICFQDTISQKSVDIQSRSDDQHSLSSAERVAMETRRQSQYSSTSGMTEDGSRSRNSTSKSSLH